LGVPRKLLNWYTSGEFNGGGKKKKQREKERACRSKHVQWAQINEPFCEKSVRIGVKGVNYRAK